VDDVAATASAVAGKGVRVLGDGSPQHNVHGERIAFLHPRDFLGALVELEESKAKGESRKSKGKS
jgi:methylmalonyl-CoA/ethylmalonyl-CoA epimerase